MAQYYFTVASLPTLTIDEQPFFSTEDLSEICTYELSDSETDTVERALRYYDESNPDDSFDGALGVYHVWERSIRSALRIQRAQKLGWDLADSTYESYPEAERIARELMSQTSPHEAEMMLQRARWRKLEELSVGHYFDSDFIILYILKALVNQRYRQMEKENGAERFNELYSNLVQTISHSPE